MESLTDATLEAFRLLLSGNAELWEIIGISFRVSTTAILLASMLAVFLAFSLAFFSFPGRRLLISISNTLLAMPAVVIGLLVYLLLSNQGPLGSWKLLFTQSAMVIAQFLMALPILVAMGHSAFQSADHRAWESARTLGMGPVSSFLIIINEVKFALVAAMIAGFGRIIAEVGASLMVGGNILHHTRNIPTAIAMETSKGNFAQGIALGMVLIALAFALNLALQYVQGRGKLAT